MAVSKEFELLELREFIAGGKTLVEYLIVDCVNDRVPSRNDFGIKVRERLALGFPADASLPIEVRALREDFPRELAHLNAVPPNAPCSLCVYLEPWSTVLRTWTPQRFLLRVLAWLADSARGDLHRRDQPLEPLFFDVPLMVVVPPKFEELFRGGHRATIFRVERDGKTATLRVVPKQPGEEQTDVVPLFVSVEPVIHGSVEALPPDLGTLADSLLRRGSGLLDELCDAVRDTVSEAGVGLVERQTCLLLLEVPVSRDANGGPEKTVMYGFHIELNLAELGQKLEVLAVANGRYFKTEILGDVAPTPTAWRSIPIAQLSVRTTLTAMKARDVSAVSTVGADDRRVLVGVGALGSRLAEIWGRIAWGKWTLIDGDFVQPHNVARHVANGFDIGRYKADVVQETVAVNDYSEWESPTAVTRFATAGLAELNENSASLLVDASTTLEFPRDIARRNDVARSASVFLTPSGAASVLLLEDAQRELRLDCLEAQYYASVLSSPWGDEHLSNHLGRYWVGGGCRDISTRISVEQIDLHAAILARQLRLRSTEEHACICVWTSNDSSGSVSSEQIPVHDVLEAESQGWRVVLSRGSQQKLVELRQAALPRETGGIIVGFVDQVTQSIFVVDVLPEPRDSSGTCASFVRGTESVMQTLEEIQERTANVVGYLGEWHSHPANHSPAPSVADFKLVDYLAKVLAQDGLPALMMIIGHADELSINVRTLQ